MIQECLDRIAVMVVFLFSAESARQFAQQTADPPISQFQDESDDDRRVLSEYEDITNCSQGVDDQGLENTTTLEESTETDALGKNGNNNNNNEGNKSTVHGTISNIVRHEQILLRSCKTSLCISFTITVVVIPVSMVMISVLYINVNTSNLCYQQLLNNNSLPHEFMKYVITGHDIEGMALNFWFQLMLVLLFGWKKFKSQHSSTLLLGFVLGLLVVIFKTTLFLVNIDFTQTKYRYPGNVVFLFGVVYTSHLVAKRVCTTFSSDAIRLKRRHVFAIVSTQFFLGFLIAMAYRYSFVPWYRSTNNGIDQASIAMITPILIILPMVISEKLAIKGLPFTDASRIFVLVYFVNGVSILLYCTMQAGVNDLNIFIALSVFRGVFQVFQTATVKLRRKFCTGIWKCLERMCTSCPPLGELEESSYCCRLRVDKEIQIMLYQGIAIIISQAYLVIYLTSNFHVETRDVLEEFIMKRVFIGIGISFVANFLSILIHIHWHKTQLTKVWFSHWKLHLLAVTLVGIMTICYFTAVLLGLFETFAHLKKYHIKDCTEPFQ